MRTRTTGNIHGKMGHWFQNNLILYDVYLIYSEVLTFAKKLTKDKDLIRRMKLETHQDLIGIIDENIAVHFGQSAKFVLENLINHLNPCPQGKFRVEALCHLSSFYF